MNGTPYIFGNLQDGFCQYPQDYTSEIFQSMFDQSVSEQQLVIHRKGDLIYYAYIARLNADGNSDKFIGLCMMLNGEMVSDVKSLYPVFEDLVNDIIRRKKILHRSYHGRVVSSVSNLTDMMTETNQIIRDLNEAFASLNSAMLPLPPSKQVEAKHNTRSFIISDDSEKILRSSYENEYTFIHKYKTGFHYSAFARSARNQRREARKKRQVIIVGGVILLVAGIVWLNELTSDDNKWAKENLSQNTEKIKTKQYLEITATTTFLYLAPDTDGGVLLDSLNNAIVVRKGSLLDYGLTIGEFHEIVYKGHRAFVEGSKSKVVSQQF